jgi:hypothetical protein
VWHFKKQEPGDTSREPIQGEFFADESIEYAAAALVREGIQNSLDARASAQPARVRIFLSASNGALAPEATRVYLEGLWPHLEAPKNGLIERPDRKDRCPFLAFEDFGTTGVTGDPGQWHYLDGKPNSFFAFFRAEGLSDKTKSDRGRWGVGKFVFPRSSRISTLFGLTVRIDDRLPLLLGRCILKSHSVERTRYSPDGYFGQRSQGQLVMPYEASDLIKGFSQTWHLKRRGEAGLSVVVPFCDDEITYQSLIAAVSRDFFYAIVRGDLVAEVETPGERTVVDHDSIDAVIASLSDETVRDRTKGLLALSRWALVTGRRELRNLPLPTFRGAPKWSATMIPDEVLKNLRSSQAQPGGRFAVRVPVVVRSKKGDPSNSFFEVFVERAGNDHLDRPVFVREGLIISDVKSRRTRGVRSLVIIEDGALASFLGDSENPSHTRWHKDSSNFKGKYTFGPGLLDFVTESVSQILAILQETDSEVDRELLADLFSLEVPEGESAAAKGKDQKGTRTAPPSVPSTAHKRSFRVSRVEGGFRIETADQGSLRPESLEVLVAYDVRSGNPLASYDPADFRLDTNPISLVPPPHGLAIREIGMNRILLDLQDATFELTVRGFDPLRDLYVSVRERAV